MTSRERVLKALNHQEPDRVPFDFGTTAYTTIHPLAYRRLLDHLNVDVARLKYDPVWQYAWVDEKLQVRLKADARGLFPDLPPQPLVVEDDLHRYITDEWGITYRQPKSAPFYFDLYQHPLKGATIDDIRKYKWPDPRDPARMEGIKSLAKKLRETGEYAVTTGAHGFCFGLLLTSSCLQGFEDCYANLAGNPRLAEEVLEQVLERELVYWDAFLDEAEGNVDVVTFGDDLGGQVGTLISPAAVRRYLVPRYKRLYGFIKSKAPNVRIFMHSDGNIRSIIPDLIECGVDILNPVQVGARSMDSKELKREFGDALTFWGGGVDTQHVLPNGTPQQVRDEVKRRIEDFAPGGGYVFATIHNINHDVPPENIMAMWETLQEFGVY